MDTGKEKAKAKIEALVSQFKEQYASYHANTYDEARLRIDFINKFFTALGWDVANDNELAEDYREVIYEDKLKIGGSTKAPDYGFRLSGSEKRLFFVEAKKPAVPVKTDKSAAYQLRRYGRSAQTPVSILTNFEEFAIYDCGKTPAENDSAAVNRIKYLRYEDYPAEFDFIYDTFSREAVVKGRFDKFVQSDTNKRGSVPLDKEFVELLNTWRKYLAVSIAKNNVQLNEEQLNFAVQQTIDRLIFLRFCEDRAVEHYGNLKNTTAKGDTYQNLLAVFADADAKYNSGLFDFEKDTITKNLKVDNKVIKNIVQELYYPKCEYEFSVMPVEILGNAYEQFLGKVIRITPAHSARIDDKPEVRKAGGVYYTPQYIVDYIVAHTVGELVKGKSPKEIAQIKIVDPACGSGSFLLGAFKYLLKHYTDWYIANGYMDKKNGGGKLTPGGRLVTAEKRKILLTHIYGVDLDSNAVEVSKLSLLLKSMEGETQASINQQLSLHHERILPDLDNNIKNGNSLIDTDIYDSEMDLGYEKTIKPFSWKQAFPEVFKQGGFDVVIGNPPYVRQELLDSKQKEYFAQKYKVYHGTADLYTYFFERGIGLLNDTGVFGIIVASKWMRANYGEPLRKWVKTKNIKEIIDFGGLPVFQGVTTYPCIFIAGTGKLEKQVNVTNVKNLHFLNLKDYVNQNEIQLWQTSLDDNGWNLASDSEQKLLLKIRSSGVPLLQYVKGKIYYGLKTALNEAFVIDDETKNRLIAEDRKSAEIIKPFLSGKDIKRFIPPGSNKHLILFKKGFTNLKSKGAKNAWAWLQANYPALARHLKPFEEAGKKRQDKGDYWWELRACDYYEEFEKPKIIIPTIVKDGSYTFDKDGFYSNDKTSIIPTKDFYLLGLLNSTVVDYFLKSIASTKQGGYFEYKPMYVSKLPIKKIDFANEGEKAKHDEIVSLVELLLKLNEELKEEKLQNNIEQIKQRIAYSDKKIDELVYQLYGLNSDEIAIIEAATETK
ncbi:MAG TPA: N-6 DNA methylase [Chitinophagales bacterium]|nr:N-6 DNA methylase [Chitinophagales bacterium]